MKTSAVKKTIWFIATVKYNHHKLKLNLKFYLFLKQQITLKCLGKIFQFRRQQQVPQSSFRKTIRSLTTAFFTIQFPYENYINVGNSQENELL